MAELSSNQIRGAEFRSAIRGLDRSEVEAFLDAVAERVDELEEQQQKLAAQIGEASERDLETEFEAIGQEVSGILQAAREASDAMRERASVDAAKWRADAMSEAEQSRREAAADSEAMRRDAWASGTELLQQSQTEAKRIKEQSERDVLTTMGEAEREAHRLTSGARREAEDLVRSAAMDAEKTTSETAKRRDDIIDQANRQAAAAQERARALEQRRDELLEELENVRSTLTQLEGSLAEKRETMELTTKPDQSTTVRVVPTQPVDIENWQPGETVRIIRGDDEPESAPEPEPTPEESPVSEPEPEGPAETVVEEASPEPEAGIEEPEAEEPDAAADDVGALFDSLRDGGTTPPSDSPPEPAPVADSPAASVSPATDWIEERDARLLPITNRALRGAKKAMTELQNIALDSLRTDKDWRPDQSVVGEALRADLIALWSESFAAGHSVAEEMTASKIKRPATPDTEVIEEFASALTDAVVSSLEASGDGQRERQASASKVFRVWRTDEAERRVREIAIRGYERGIEASVHANV